MCAGIADKSYRSIKMRETVVGGGMVLGGDLIAFPAVQCTFLRKCLEPGIRLYKTLAALGAPSSRRRRVSRSAGF